LMPRCGGEIFACSSRKRRPERDSEGPIVVQFFPMFALVVGA
jgi:hypothetical protein